ncbi:MAG: hypothetical protein QG622_342 [Actinomycetota bacterium]|nr:hypothetical protein [Actinomycetota bacterium]
MICAPLISPLGAGDEKLPRVSRPSRKTFPVTVTRMPVVRCQICGQNVTNLRVPAAEALTEHYRRDHPELLGDDGSYHDE